MRAYIEIAQDMKSRAYEDVTALFCRTANENAVNGGRLTPETTQVYRMNCPLGRSIQVSCSNEFNTFMFSAEGNKRLDPIERAWISQMFFDGEPLVPSPNGKWDMIDVGD